MIVKIAKRSRRDKEILTNETDQIFQKYKQESVILYSTVQ